MVKIVYSNKNQSLLPFFFGNKLSFSKAKVEPLVLIKVKRGGRWM